MGIIALPWSFKILYGFISDNISVFNSKRKGYIILNTICCAISVGLLILFGIQLGKKFVTFCLFISQVNMAFVDTIADALTVRASNSKADI